MMYLFRVLYYTQTLSTIPTMCVGYITIEFVTINLRRCPNDRTTNTCRRH